MIILAPHPTEELLLIKYQKELIKRIFTPGVIIYAHQPLWIPVEFSSVEEAKKSITKVTVLTPEYDEEKKNIKCMVKLDSQAALRQAQEPQSNSGQQSHSGSLRLSKGATTSLPLIHINSNIPDINTLLQDTKIFPLPLKIFRLGECTSPSPDIYELNNVVWKKIT